MVQIAQKDIDRFNKFWEQVGECKLWKNFLDRNGYGSFYFRKKLRRAHRVAYYFVHGDIPEKMVIDHICKNTSCVEIKHLRLVTIKQNSLENSLSRGAINAAKINCPKGHKLDKKWGKQRYCSICMAEKRKRLRLKWSEEANKTKC